MRAATAKVACVLLASYFDEVVLSDDGCNIIIFINNCFGNIVEGYLKNLYWCAAAKPQKIQSW
jgi:hypothetical protein